MNPDHDIPAELIADIDAYYDGDLSPEAAQSLRDKLNADPDLTAAAARYESLYRLALQPTSDDLKTRDDLRSQLHELESKLPPLEIGQGRRLWPRLLGVAATVLLLLAVGWWLLGQPDADTRLAKENFFWLEREQALLGPADDAQRGLAAYDQGEYEQAFPLLRDGIATGVLDSVNLLYAGVSALGSGRPLEAKELLTEMLETEKYPYDEADLRYYLGLAELRLGNRLQARRQFEFARDLDGRSSPRARQILTQLDTVE